MINGQERLELLLEDYPYASVLGVRGEMDGGVLTAALPFEGNLVGNVELPALHGGVIAAVLQLTAQLQLALTADRMSLPPAIDVTITYMRPGLAEDLCAQAQIRRLGQRIATVDVEAWQKSRDQLVAILRGSFLMAP